MRNHDARLHRLAEITLKKLRELDRSRTIVLLPIGMIEAHGEHLPLGTDSIAVEALTSAACAWLLDTDPDMHIVLMPTIPYGSDPIDLRRPDQFNKAGSVWIGADTLKAIITDLVGHMVRYGFTYIFPIGFHGGGLHNIALGDVCAELRTQYPNVVIDEPVGYVLAGGGREVMPGLSTLLGRTLTVQERVALQGSVHASMFETSMMLSLRPQLVDPDYLYLRSIEWRDVYKLEQWPGYIGSGPRHASPEVGAAVLRWRGVRAGALIYRAVKGEDLTHLPRHPAWEPDQLKEIPEDEREPHKETTPELFLSPEDVARLQSEVDTKTGHDTDQLDGNTEDTADDA
ncbi:MAG: creatininase family protein [Anaerolineae bacterium]